MLRKRVPQSLYISRFRERVSCVSSERRGSMRQRKLRDHVAKKQAGDLQEAKEIIRLNKQLQSRNQLLHQIFGRYFSDNVVDSILEDPKGAVIGGEKRKLTVMMADLRGFTAMSEKRRRRR